jgi:hypothetical protein
LFRIALSPFSIEVGDGTLEHFNTIAEQSYPNIATVTDHASHDPCLVAMVDDLIRVAKLPAAYLAIIASLFEKGPHLFDRQAILIGSLVLGPLFGVVSFPLPLVVSDPNLIFFAVLLKLVLVALGVETVVLSLLLFIDGHASSGQILPNLDAAVNIA